MARRSYSRVVEHLHWFEMLAFTPAECRAIRNAPFPGRIDGRFGVAVRRACEQMGWEARQRLAAARTAHGATSGAATPVRAV